MDYSNVVVMLSRQSSQTNLLREVFDVHADIFCLPEVFHPEPSPEANLEVDTNYFNFLERHSRDAIKDVLTSQEA